MARITSISGILFPIYDETSHALPRKLKAGEYTREIILNPGGEIKITFSLFDFEIYLDLFKNSLKTFSKLPAAAKTETDYQCIAFLTMIIERMEIEKSEMLAVQNLKTLIHDK